jgi:hypothetical protein
MLAIWVALPESFGCEVESPLNLAAVSSQALQGPWEELALPTLYVFSNLFPPPYSRILSVAENQYAADESLAQRGCYGFET